MTHHLSPADVSIFPPEISNFCYIKKCRYRLHFDTLFLILLMLFESLKVVLITMVSILMMSAKFATLGLLKIRKFLNEGYDVIISVHDITIKILLRESNYIVVVVM